MKTVDAAVRKNNQRIRRIEHSMKEGLTASVIDEEEGRQDSTNGKQLNPIRGKNLKQINLQKKYGYIIGKQRGSNYRMNGTRRRETGTDMTEQFLQERSYRTTGMGSRKLRGDRYTGSLPAGQGNRYAYPGSVTQGMTTRAGVGEMDVGADGRIHKSVFSPRIPKKGIGAGTGTTTKWAGTSARTSKGAAKVAGVSVKGTTAAASGVATAGTSTAAFAAVTAVSAAKRVAKRAADRAREALEASIVRSHSSGNTSQNMNQEEIPGYGKSGDQKGTGIAALGISAGIIMLILLLMMSALLILPLAMYQETQGQTGAEGGKQIVAVAKQEAVDAEKNIGGSKYKAWYGMDDNWCAMFVSWCADQCGYIESGIMPKTASVANMKSWYQQRGLYYAKESGYEPKPGDVILFGNGRSHTGLVVEYDPDTKTVTTVEGNTGTSGTTPYHKGSQVKEKKYPLTYRTIAGYGTPEYPTDTEEDSETVGTEQ